MIGDYERTEYRMDNSIFYSWPDEYANACVVFIHGLAGHPEKTWKNLPTFLMGSAFARNKDIVSYSYKTSILSARGANTEACIDNFVTFAETFLSRYERVYFITHSLGSVITIGSIPILAQRDSIWSRKIRGIILLAPALWGSNWADWATLIKLPLFLPHGVIDFLPLSKLIYELRPSSTKLKSIRETWSSFNSTAQINSAFIHGTRDTVVAPNRSELQIMGVQPLSAETNHTKISKVATLSDSLYVMILNTLYSFDGGNYRDRRQYILQTVYDSKKEDWEYDDELAEFVYLPDFDIRINKIADDTFFEKWLTIFPAHSHASIPNPAKLEDFNITYKRLRIHTFSMIAVDGHRYLFPMPKGPNDLRITRRQYCVAKIMESRGMYRNLDQGLEIAGFTIDDSLEEGAGGF